MNCLRCRIQIQEGQEKYGLHAECFTAWFKVAPTSDFMSLTPRSAQSNEPKSDADISNQNTSFYHGKFKKYSADLASVGYILKMREEKEAPELPEVEYLCNQIGSLVGIPVAEHFYIDFYGEKVFVTKNFINKGSNSNLEHIYKFRPDQEHSCERILKAIQEHTKRPYDVNVFLNTLLYDALVGNHDRHGRNLGLIVTPNKIILSPIYDNVSYLSLVTGGLLRADLHPTGRINTKTTFEPSMQDYVTEIKRLGHDDVIESFGTKLKRDKILQLIEISYCSDAMKAALKTLILKRIKEFENAI